MASGPGGCWSWHIHVAPRSRQGKQELMLLAPWRFGGIAVCNFGLHVGIEQVKVPLDPPPQAVRSMGATDRTLGPPTATGSPSHITSVAMASQVLPLPSPLSFCSPEPWGLGSPIPTHILVLSPDKLWAVVSGRISSLTRGPGPACSQPTPATQAREGPLCTHRLCAFVGHVDGSWHKAPSQGPGWAELHYAWGLHTAHWAHQLTACRCEVCQPQKAPEPVPAAWGPTHPQRWPWRSLVPKQRVAGESQLAAAAVLGLERLPGVSTSSWRRLSYSFRGNCIVL